MAKSGKGTNNHPSGSPKSQRDKKRRRRHRQDRESWAPKTGSNHSRTSEPATSLIGGIRGQGIKAIKPASASAPIEHELTEDERRAKWQPPDRDTSRFSGTSASRHKASSSYKDHSDYSPTAYGKSSSKPSKKKDGGTGETAASPFAETDWLGFPLSTRPLNSKEAQVLDDAYRIHGGFPMWDGWDRLLPRRSADFLLSQVSVLGFDKYDDKKWTERERATLRAFRKFLKEDDPLWQKLLPRKSAKAIANACLEMRHEDSLPDDLGH